MLNARNWLRKATWLFGMVILAYVLLLTASRAGLLALLVGLGVCLVEFGVKGRRYYLVVATALLVLAILLSAGAVVRERFEALFDPSMSSVNDVAARGSSIQRQDLFWKSITVTAEHPLFGVGPGNFTSISGSWHDPHNSYSQMSAEGGIPALMLYLIVFSLAFGNARETRRSLDATGEELVLAGALRASLAGYIVGSLFCSVAYHFFPYFLVAYSCVLRAIVEKNKGLNLNESRASGRIAGNEVINGQEGRITWSDYRKGRSLAGAQ
jgi:O-antigen ligase